MLRGLTIVYAGFNIRFLKSFGQITHVYILMAFQCVKTTFIKNYWFDKKIKNSID